MFKLDVSASYFWPVTVQIPTDGGLFEKATFDAEFKRLSQSRIDEVRADVGGDDFDYVSLCREVLVGWKGITAGGADLPYSETNRDAVLDVAGVPLAIIKAFTESVSGGGAQQKN